MKIFRAHLGTAVLEPEPVAVIFTEQPDHDKHLNILNDQMKENEFQSAWVQGAEMDLNEAVAFALEGYKSED